MSDLQIWVVVVIALSPIWFYVLAKMVTFGVLKAKKQFNQESEAGDGSESS